MQNIISIDPNSLKIVSVVYGPGSVKYGSDALGGVIEFITADAVYPQETDYLIDTKAMLRYSSANNERTFNSNLIFANKVISSLTSVTHSNFGDLRAGTKNTDIYGDIAFRNHSVKVLNNEDVMIENDKPELQLNSGYSQLNILQKLSFEPFHLTKVDYTLNYSVTGNIPRYDRLTQYNGENFKYAEWYYGPQKLLTNTLHVEKKSKKFRIEKSDYIVSTQKYYESRHSRRFQSSELNSNYEEVDVVFAKANFDRRYAYNFYTSYGIEATYNDVKSIGEILDISTNEIVPNASRYPEKSTYVLGSAYIHTKKIIDQYAYLTAGVRYNYVYLNSDFSNKTFYDFPYDNITIKTDATNVSFGAYYQNLRGVVFKINAATGFRAPNVDDVGKVFDSEPGNVVVPNRNLKPEYAYNIDFSIQNKSLKAIDIELNTFFVLLRDAMVRRDVLFNGMDSIFYNGQLSKVQSLVNAEKAMIYGGTMVFKYKFDKYFSIATNLTLTKGQTSDNEPLRHVPPFFAQSKMVYENEKLKVELSSNYNGRIAYKNMATTEIEKPHLYAKDANGNPYSPAWHTFNFKAIYNPVKQLKVVFSTENIFDRYYRTYSSGIAAAGRNFSIALRWNFNHEL